RPAPTPRSPLLLWYPCSVPLTSLCVCCPPVFFSTSPATAKIYTLSLHDALPISHRRACEVDCRGRARHRGAGAHSRCDLHRRGGCGGAGAVWCEPVLRCGAPIR